MVTFINYYHSLIIFRRVWFQLQTSGAISQLLNVLPELPKGLHIQASFKPGGLNLHSEDSWNFQDRSRRSQCTVVLSRSQHSKGCRKSLHQFKECGLLQYQGWNYLPTSIVREEVDAQGPDRGIQARWASELFDDLEISLGHGYYC